jgi:hypothetical protein
MAARVVSERNAMPVKPLDTEVGAGESSLYLLSTRICRTLEGEVESR